MSAKTIVAVTSTGSPQDGTHEYILWELARSAANGDEILAFSDLTFWSGFYLEAFMVFVTPMQRFRKKDDDGNQFILLHKHRLLGRESGVVDPEFDTDSDSSEVRDAIDVCTSGLNPRNVLVLVHGLRSEDDVSATLSSRTHELSHVKQSRPDRPNMYNYVKSLVVVESNREEDRVWKSLPEDWTSRFNTLFNAFDSMRGHFDI